MVQTSEVDDRILLVEPLKGRVKTPSAVWNHPQGTPKFTQLDYIDQRVNKRLWARATHNPTGSLDCTVGGDPLAMVMFKKALAASITSSLLKEIIICKICGKHEFCLSFNVIIT